MEKVLFIKEWLSKRNKQNALIDDALIVYWPDVKPDGTLNIILENGGYITKIKSYQF